VGLINTTKNTTIAIDRTRG